MANTAMAATVVMSGPADAAPVVVAAAVAELVAAVPHQMVESPVGD